MSKDLAKTPCKRLTKKQLAQLASFTDPGTVLSVLAKEKWSIEESIQHLVSIAKGKEKGTKTSVQLNAIKYLNQLVVDAMERSGLMVMARKKFIGADGQEVQFSGHVVSSVLGGQKETTKEDLIENPIPDKKEDTNERKRSTTESDDGESGSGSDNGRESDTGGKEASSESELRSTKTPCGEQADAGHFRGIAKQGGDEITGQGSGDYL